MKGVLFKYDADPTDSLMRDHQAICGASICGMMDPDFWTNQVPVWGICGPYVRQKLKLGDILFYLPKIGSLQKAGLNEYICTGILAVQTLLKNSDSVIVDSQLTENYKKEYIEDLENHLRQDKQKTKQIRGKNFVKGNSEESYWLGRNSILLKQVLSESNILDPIKLGYQKIPYLNQNQTLTLYNKLVQLHTNTREQ